MSNEIAIRPAFSLEQIELIKRTVCQGASDDELKLFVQVCERTGLDPFTKQIYAIKRWNTELHRETTAYQTGIDGFRLIAERTGKYAGQQGPYWCGQDGIWKEVWLSEQSPAAAKVGVMRSDFKEPLYAVAKFSTYCQLKKDGTPNSFWLRMSELMIGKVAEALALRRAFPRELSGLYTFDEMAQAGSPIAISTMNRGSDDHRGETSTNGNQTPTATPSLFDDFWKSLAAEFKAYGASTTGPYRPLFGTKHLNASSGTDVRDDLELCFDWLWDEPSITGLRNDFGVLEMTDLRKVTEPGFFFAILDIAKREIGKREAAKVF